MSVAGDCSVGCVGEGHKPPCDSHSWIQSALKTMWAAPACQDLCQPGEQHNALLKQISVKMCQQLWTRDRAAEDTARATCVQIACWRCLLERRCSMQRQYLQRLCGLCAAQEQAGGQTEATLAGGRPLLGKTWKQSGRKTWRNLSMYFKMFLRSKLVVFFNGFRVYGSILKVSQTYLSLCNILLFQLI